MTVYASTVDELAALYSKLTTYRAYPCFFDGTLANDDIMDGTQSLSLKGILAKLNSSLEYMCIRSQGTQIYCGRFNPSTMTFSTIYVYNGTARS